MADLTNATNEDVVLAQEQQAPRRLGRRELLKVVAASGGAVAASAVLAGKWDTPLVQVGVLPAHAQVSPACSPPDTPTQIAPPDDTTFPVGTDVVSISWSAVNLPEGCQCMCYGIEIQQSELTAAAPSWETVVLDDDLEDPHYDFIPNNQQAAYRWRVWACTAAGCSDSSPWWYFQFAAMPQCGPPATPQQVSPANNVIVPWSGTGVVLDWDPVPLPAGCTTLNYHSQIERLNTLGGWEFVANLLNSPNTEFPVTTAQLGDSGFFRWWVMATTEGGSAQSGWWYFSFVPIDPSSKE